MLWGPPKTGAQQAGPAPGSLALCPAGGAGAAAGRGAGASGHGGGVGPPRGPRGPPAAGPGAESPHLLRGEVPSGWGGLGRGGGGPAELPAPLCPQGLSPGLRREAWKFLLGYLSWEGSAEEHKAHMRKKT